MAISTDSVSVFLTRLRESQILEAGQLDAVARVVAQKNPDLRTLARNLVQQGWLTPYQANQILQGKGKELVLGSYVILERLGEGGMGQVFKARHARLGRIVALKVVRKQHLANPLAVRRFRREIEAVAQLSHPNIVAAYDSDEVDGSHFFVMEFVDGIDLGRMVKENGPLPIAEACDVIRQAALGLQHAHERGFVHRDIKPANLLVSKSGPQGTGQVKILDMGLVRVADPDDQIHSLLTQDGKVVGTPDYMAPEQARNSHTSDIRADLYSLGCTFYYLLTGEVLFPGSTAMEKLFKHQSEPPTPVRKLRPEVPAEVDAIVARLLAKKPEERFQTPIELALALEPLLPASSRTAPALSAPRLPAATTDVLETPVVVPDRDTAVRRSTGADDTTESGPLPANRSGKHRAVVAAAARLPGLLSHRKFLAGAAAGIVLAVALVAWFVSRPSDRPPPSTSPTPGEQTKERPPLERPDPVKLPPEQRVLGQPRGLVGVLGDHRGRTWSGVRKLSFSSNGKWLVVATNDNAIRTLDTATWRERSMFRIPGGPLMDTVAISPDGQLVAVARTASGNDPGGVTLFDASTGAEKAHLPIPATWKMSGLFFSSDSRTLLVFPWKEAPRLWDVATVQPKPAGDLAALQGSVLAVTPDLQSAVTYNYSRHPGTSPAHELAVRHLSTGQGRSIFRSHTNRVTTAAISPDGRTVVSLAAEYHRASEVKLWDADTGREQPIAGVPEMPMSAAFSPDGKVLAIGGQDGKIALWDSGKRTPRTTFKAHRGSVTTLTFSGDGLILASAGADHSLRLWDLPSGKEHAPTADTPMPPRQLVVSADGRTVTTVAREWDGGKDVLVARSWNIDTGKVKVLLQVPILEMTALALAADGRSLVAAHLDPGDGFTTTGFIRRWDLDTGKELILAQGASLRVHQLAISLDGKLIAAANSTGGTVQAWDISAGTPRALLPAPKSIAVSTRLLRFSADGKTLLAAGSDVGYRDCLFRRWDLATGKLDSRKEAFDLYEPVALSPDGRLLAGIFREGGGVAGMTAMLRIWDLAQGKERARLVPPSSLQTLSFSADGRLLAGSDRVGRITFWDTADGRELASLELPGPISAMQFAANGRRLVTGNGNGTLYVLRLPKDLRSAAAGTGPEEPAPDRDPLPILPKLDKPKKLPLAPVQPLMPKPDASKPDAPITNSDSD